MTEIRILSGKISESNCESESKRLPLSVLEFSCDDDIVRKINSGVFKTLNIEVDNLRISPFEKETAGVLHLDHEIKVIRRGLKRSKHNEKDIVTLERI